MTNLLKIMELRGLKFLCIPFCIIISLMFSSVIGAQTGDVPKIWSSGAHFMWVGNEVPNPESLSIIINGSPVLPERLTINNYEGMVHVRIQLDKGISNLISIQEGDYILFTADLFSAPTYESALVPEVYELKSFHTEENEDPCAECHRLNPQDSDMVPGNPSEKICFPCHNDKFSGLKFQHTAAGVNWECLRCHQPEALETDYSFSATRNRKHCFLTINICTVRSQWADAICATTLMARTLNIFCKKRTLPYASNAMECRNF